MRGIFASDLTLAEVKTLKAKQRLEFRDHSHDGLYSIVTFEEFLDLALAAGRPVGVYPGACCRRVAASACVEFARVKAKQLQPHPPQQNLPHSAGCRSAPTM